MWLRMTLNFWVFSSTGFIGMQQHSCFTLCWGLNSTSILPTQWHPPWGRSRSQLISPQNPLWQILYRNDIHVLSWSLGLGPQRNYCRSQYAVSKDSFLCSWQSSNKWISLPESCPKFIWGTFLQLSVCKPGSDHHHCCRPGSCRELLAAGAGCFMVNLSNKASKKGFYLILYLSNSQSCE